MDPLVRTGNQSQCFTEALLTDCKQFRIIRSVVSKVFTSVHDVV
jgi:hypothetical protein